MANVCLSPHILVMKNIQKPSFHFISCPTVPLEMSKLIFFGRGMNNEQLQTVKGHLQFIGQGTSFHRLEDLV